ncbi:MAG: 3-hydroxyacyl-ACP dehydratase [Bacteroidia bacterium]
MKTDATILIPQKPPFVMVDHILHSDDTTTRTSFHIQEDNIFVEDGLFGEAGLLENIAQTAAARLGYESSKQGAEVPLGFIGAVKNFEVKNLPPVHSEINTEVTIVTQVFDVTLVRGTVSLGNQVLAECEMKIVIQKN